jgi:hypothetical protein
MVLFGFGQPGHFRQKGIKKTCVPSYMALDSDSKRYRVPQLLGDRRHSDKEGPSSEMIPRRENPILDHLYPANELVVVDFRNGMRRRGEAWSSP